MASTPSYINPASGAKGVLTLTTSLQLITTGQTNGSFLVRAVLVSSNASARTITISDENDNTLSVVTLNATAGTGANVKPLDLLNTDGIPSENDAYGNKVFRMRSTEGLKIKTDSVTGGAPTLHWERVDF